MNLYADIDSLTGENQLRLVASGPNVHITLRHIDGFDADLDMDEVVGNFHLDTLRSRLERLGAPTAPTPVQASRPGRRKPRRWWR